MADMTAEERAWKVVELAPAVGSERMKVQCGRCWTKFNIAGMPLPADLIPLTMGIAATIREAEDAAYKRGWEDALEKLAKKFEDDACHYDGHYVAREARDLQPGLVGDGACCCGGIKCRIVTTGASLVGMS
jgi:sugar phosphate isomerase/epimerase